MATAIISGRVEESVKERASAYIHAAGFTFADIVKTVIENIAKTGEIPTSVQDQTVSDGDPFEAFISFCDSLPTSNAFPVDMTDEQMRATITEMLEEKYA